MAAALCTTEVTVACGSLSRHSGFSSGSQGEVGRAESVALPTWLISKSSRKCALHGCSRESSVREPNRLCERLSSHRHSSVRAVANADGVAAVDVPLESDAGVSYELLRDKLAAGEWEEADNETRRLLCVLAGEGAIKRKWVYYSEVQFIPDKDLLTMDSLWRSYSGGRYGYSVQRRIWNNSGRRWKPFFMRIGWTIGELNSFRKFPLDFFWNNDAETPVGHLPLTNALRGTQLLQNIFLHPAFAVFDEEGEMPADESPLPASLFNGATSENGSSNSSSAGGDRQANVAADLMSEIDYGF
eukprot:TRINITY_DN7660_c0_g1_i1.p1 TRINITY_DN7660_c0_g1~~TRINITY_DN7660_c0_g1_i1.p1  ORF type:complete len:313 (-),score=46.83 TRINITY_DN7660_c0_g1_i1:845-1744(-)